MSTPDDSDAQDADPSEPSEEDVAQIRASTQEERDTVQALVLQACTHRWQKVAKVVGSLLVEFDRTYEHLPYAFIQAVMEKLEELGKVEIAGNVWVMGHSEIRLAQPKTDAP